MFDVLEDDAQALDEMRTFRRLITWRLGGLAALAALAAARFDHPAPVARWAVVVGLLVPPLLARIAEHRLARRLDTRLHRLLPGHARKAA